MTSTSRSALIGSSPENGSSKMTRLGSWTMVATNWTFCCWPFESSSVFFPAQPAASNRSSHRPTAARASRSGIPLSWAR